MGGTNGLEPVARISTSYSYSAPLRVMTRLPLRSMELTGSPECSSMPFLSKNSRVVRVSSATLLPEKNFERLTRS